jgi:hypothetical protein
MSSIEISLGFSFKRVKDHIQNSKNLRCYPQNKEKVLPKVRSGFTVISPINATKCILRETGDMEENHHHCNMGPFMRSIHAIIEICFS